VRDFAEEAFRVVGMDWSQHVQTDPSVMKKHAQTLRGELSQARSGDRLEAADELPRDGGNACRTGSVWLI
jgi:hypothetical protein